jgi:hypothetical protein
MTERTTRDDEIAVAAAPTSDRTITDRRLLLVGLLVTLLVAAFGIYARDRMLEMGLVRPSSANIFFRLYALHELPFLILLVVTAVVAGAIVLRRPDAGDASASPFVDRQGAGPSQRAVLALAGLVFVGALASWYVVHHSLLFAMDEFTTEFLARIFAAGRLQALVPEAWRPIAPAMTPVFSTYHPDAGTWVSLYLPGYAALKALFVPLGAGAVLNPLFAAGAVLAMAAVARRIWPGESLRPWVAIGVLVTSSQFAVTSGTGYSMPAHLCLNLVWLWLYLRDDARSWAAALVIGALALGLHNPFPHALFVAPFMLRLLRDRRWARLGAAAVVYLAAAALLMGWMRMAHPLAGAGGPGVLSVFALPGITGLWLQMVHATLLFTWHAPLVGALALAGYVRTRRADPLLADVALGVLITLGFYAFFPLTQGHGWGYRYSYQILGSLALLAAAGAPTLLRAAGERRGRLVLAGACAVALLVQLPLRALQTERFVRPFAAASRLVQERDADVVLVHADSVWYGRDLIRNDPFLAGQPVVLYGGMLSAYGREMLERAHPGRVAEIRDRDLLALGMTRWDRSRRR